MNTGPHHIITQLELPEAWCLAEALTHNLMKFVHPIAFVFLVLFCAMAAIQGAEPVNERISASVHYIPVEGKTYSTAISKVAEGAVQFPLATSEGSRWIVQIIKRPGAKTFYISISDPSLPMSKPDNARPSLVTIFTGEFDVTNGKPVTVLKTDHYRLDVMLTVE